MSDFSDFLKFSQVIKSRDYWTFTQIRSEFKWTVGRTVVFGHKLMEMGILDNNKDRYGRHKVLIK